MKKLNKKYVLKTIATEAQLRVIFTIAKALKIQAHIKYGYANISSIDETLADYVGWNYLTLGEDGIAANRTLESLDDSDVLVSYDKFLQILASDEADFIEDSFEITLNDTYKAEVNAKTGIVKVGCQSFEIGVLIDLVAKYKAHKKLLDKQAASK